MRNKSSSDLIDKYDRLTKDIDDVYQKTEDIIASYDDAWNSDNFIDPWSNMEDILGVDILLQVAKVNRQVQS